MVKRFNFRGLKRRWFDTIRVCLSEYPRYFEFKPNDDLCIKISLSSYSFHTVTVYIVYKGNNVYLLNKCPDKVTKKKLDEVLKLAKQFDEICEIVKKACPEY